MKRIVCSLLILFSGLLAFGQTWDVNVKVDYSKALICDMDEESYAIIESDWYKDKVEITHKLTTELLKETKKFLKLKLSSPITLLVTVNSIGKEGEFNCDAEVIGENKETILSVKDIRRCTATSFWITNLRRMKINARDEGWELGRALKEQYKEKYK